MKKLFLIMSLMSVGYVGVAIANDAETLSTDEIQIKNKSVFIEDAATQSEPSSMPPLVKNDKPIVALFYADWCGSCKILEPRMEAAMAQLADKDALKIIKFDLTNDMTKAKSAATAGENGLTDLYNDNAPKTGFAILVNGNNVESVTLTKKDSVSEIKAKLESFVAQSHFS